MITVIAPHARPQFTQNLLANFRRQRGIEALLLVVENSAAIGGEWPSDVTVLRSASHQADAMNVALSSVSGSWARFDDDDYYGPDYLTQVVRDLEHSNVVGKTWGFVMFDDGLYRFTKIENGHAEFLAGGTLAARSTNVAPFTRRNDDDLQWCRDMIATGEKLWASSHLGYCYDRRSNRGGSSRVINTGPFVTRWGFGESYYYGKVPIEEVDSPSVIPVLAELPTDEQLISEM